jgi:hypothetical protein
MPLIFQSVFRFAQNPKRIHAGQKRETKLRLLLVTFDDVLSAHVGRLGIAAGLAKRTALAEEVPALIERDLERLEPPTVVVGRRPGRLALPEVVLLLDELLDVVVDRSVCHPGA